jgi:hypothetical protein
MALKRLIFWPVTSETNTLMSPSSVSCNSDQGFPSQATCRMRAEDETEGRVEAEVELEETQPSTRTSVQEEDGRPAFGSVFATRAS